MASISGKVQERFNSADKTYDLVAIIQRKAGNFLIKKLSKIQNFTPKTVLDLGTGTGYMTESLMKVYPQSHYTLNDIAERMLDICRLKFIKNPNCTFIQGDMAELDIDMHDLIVSNFALQWVEDLQKTIQTLYLNSSQIFAFSTLLDGTFREWQNIINIYTDTVLQNYPKETALAEYCNTIKGHCCFQYWTMNRTIKFDTVLSFIRYLKALGASASHRQIPFRILRTLIREQKRPLIISYKIFFGIFKKNIT
ncbi:Malonyl-[acyl-carrier protein] O-methyltransferase [Candidatus Fokinia solitaria]|uniref:Malonyl-[acyl-carrier protein] O-methyltransferase n=1 Tax=Candidatus Fokinia solitaria TaxID=1802984 RepID=A0A2U8BRY3_9RICK|nr:methyltransferase domain-containing protein [Candidatus Fokinia solitaria]AWD33114.1 Malonyl-[acyl-carrier protein] O-methyltransferase [Candidatus Fokinia solitaria]